MKEKKKTKKKAKKKIIILLIMALMIGNIGMPELSAAASAKITLSKKKITIIKGKKKKLFLKNISKSKAKKIKWSVSPKSIVKLTVSKNKKSVTLAGKKDGKATVTAKIRKKKYVCRVTVKKSNSTAKSTAPAQDTKQSSAASVSNTKNPAPQIIYVEVPVESDKRPDNGEGNLTYQKDVTYEMTKASYWADKCKNPDEILADSQKIKEINQKILTDPSTYMYDLLNIKETFDAQTKKQNLAKAIDTEVRSERVGKRDIYLNGKKVEDPDAYFESIKNNIANAMPEGEGKVKYALCTKAADLKMAPESGCVGWSAADPDDEFINSRMNVNEPFVIEATTADGKYYWGMNTNCSGWVEAENFAICDSREEWSSMWTKGGEEILVVTSSRITLAESNLDPVTSGLELTFSTVLPLVPKNELPKSLSERGTWYNYVVYVPTRDTDGKMVKKMALIGMHNQVSIGFLPFTQRNILHTAFSCLGDRYGWGGMLKSMDCSQYTRSIYKCFGFELARNTTWQKAMPVDHIDLSGMTNDEKKTAILGCTPGTLLMFSGHIVMYIGNVGDKLYVISDFGSLGEAAEYGEELNIISQYVVGINSLDVRRRSGSTWLENMLIAIMPWR